MKKASRVLALVLVLCVSCVLFAACDRDAKPFMGKWSAYKISSGTTEMNFADFNEYVTMELTLEIKSGGEYTSRYVAEEEDIRTGTYEAEEGKLTLDNGATAVIKNGELVLSNDTVVYYFKPAN